MKIGGYIFLLFGMLTLTFSIINTISYSKKNEKYTSTIATIVDYKVESREMISDDTDWKEGYIVFEYVVEEQKYSKKSYTSYVSENNIGKTIDIKYNPDDPSDVIIIGEQSLYNMPIFSVVFILVGFVLIVKLNKIKKEKTVLKTA